MEELQKLFQLITRTQLKWRNIHIFIHIGHLTIYKKICHDINGNIASKGQNL